MVGRGSRSTGMRSVPASDRRQSVPIIKKMRAWRGAVDGAPASWRAAASSVAVRAKSHDRVAEGDRNHMRVG